MILSRFNALLALVAVASTAFFFIQNESLVADPTVKVTESKVDQAPQGELVQPYPTKPNILGWYEKLSKDETKQLELNLLFPYEGKFFIEATALAYDRQLKVWKTLGQYYAYVTTKKEEEGKVEKTSTGPKVTPYKIKAEGPVISSWDKTAKWDSLKDKSAEIKPMAIPNPKPAWRLRQSMQAGEAPLELLISFEPNPKINEPTKLLLSVSSTVPRDSVYLDLIFPDSIKVIK